MSLPKDQCVDVAILGAGISGVLAAQQALNDGLSFRIIDRCQDFGGVWDFRANSYSHLQVRSVVSTCENLEAKVKLSGHQPALNGRMQAHAAAYQWEAKYALARSPFKKVPSGTVLAKIRECASDLGLNRYTTFGVEVIRVGPAAHLSKNGW